MTVATPPTPLRPLSPEESRLFDIYVDSESNFLAFRDAANLSSSEALDFLRSIPEHLEALEIQMSSAWNRFTISRKTNVIRVLEQVIAENRDNPVERRRAACAILRAIDPPRQRSTDPAATRFTPSPVQPDRVPPTPPRQRPRDPVTQAIIARANLETLRAKIEAAQPDPEQHPLPHPAQRPAQRSTRQTVPPQHQLSKPRAASRHPAGATDYSQHPQSPHSTQSPSTHPPPENTRLLPFQPNSTPPTETSHASPTLHPAASPPTRSAKLHALAGAVPHCRDPAA